MISTRTLSDQNFFKWKVNIRTKMDNVLEELEELKGRVKMLEDEKSKTKEKIPLIVSVRFFIFYLFFLLQLRLSCMNCSSRDAQCLVCFYSFVCPLYLYSVFSICLFFWVMVFVVIFKSKMAALCGQQGFIHLYVSFLFY